MMVEDTRLIEVMNLKRVAEMKNKRKNRRYDCLVPVEGKEGGPFEDTKTVDFSKSGTGFLDIGNPFLEAKELSEEVMLGAVMEAHRSFQPVIDAIIQLAEHCAKEPLPLTDPSEASKTVAAKLKAEMHGKLVEACPDDWATWAVSFLDRAFPPGG